MHTMKILLVLVTLLIVGSSVNGQTFYTVTAPETDTTKMSLPEPEDELVVNHRAITRYEKWRVEPGDTNAVWLRFTDDSIVYNIGKQSCRSAWAKKLSHEIDIERYPILTFTYRTNTKAVSKYWALWGDVVGEDDPKNGLYMVHVNDLIPDNQKHTITMDLRKIKRKVSIDRLAIAYRSTSHELPAELEIFEIKFSAVNDAKAPPVYRRGEPCTFLVTDEQGQPIEGAFVALSQDILNLQTAGHTGVDGMVTLQPYEIDSSSMTGMITHPGMFKMPIHSLRSAPMYKHYDRTIYPVTMFELADFKGRVNDMASRPIANTSIQMDVLFNKTVFHMPGVRSSWRFVTHTDEKGKFSYPLPKNLVKRISIEIDHNDFEPLPLSHNAQNQLRSGDYLVTLLPKKHITGFVLDANTHEPISGARLVRQNTCHTYKPTDFSDENGYFSFPLSSKSSSDQTDHDIVVTHPTRGTSTVKFNAPSKDEKLASFNPRPIRIYLNPEYQVGAAPPSHLYVSGEVVDFETQKPIKNFTIKVGLIPPGKETVYFQSNRKSSQSKNGNTFRVNLNNPSQPQVLVIRAKGYMPYTTTPLSFANNESSSPKLKIEMIKD
ncbi:carboxypeptidase regulatory-like domain-containing protein [Planctomycetota bacterium]|nr:carboxypeptidase regulatory-like domain-containing protein [Planctomycetota bacterium]